jgi:hypothetical protein
VVYLYMDRFRAWVARRREEKRASRRDGNVSL